MAFKFPNYIVICCSNLPQLFWDFKAFPNQPVMWSSKHDVIEALKCGPKSLDMGRGRLQVKSEPFILANQSSYVKTK